ncbi:DEAD/DEAH box helicase [Alcanivorax profundi]|jgi:ATP-dependent RNA helicase RhlE|uniref:ATP-dependent RNA helicase RhlE n=1 Tax=Alcanivorax profundi TaxID=2338368 RepID=A0A418Y1B5_9GAMM|nr:DEAD/DEAH box helicase [Alcanivorax profundi]RJG19328.1 DEAD/DEAH box helicase [Alcanivorax profundi]
MHFSDLGLCEALQTAVADHGYSTPSPIQAQAIPAVLEGRDVMAAAQTGTGKTAGFTLPLLERLRTGKAASHNQVRALVLTPTRELAAQVADSVATYGKHLPLKSTVVFGGVKINPQMQRLRGGVDILVATPGRLLDLYQQNAVKFDHLEVLVLDEADRMLDMGFIHDIRKILALLPKRRQNLMFSATFSPDIRALAKGLVNDPVEVDVSPRNTTTELVTQWIAPVDKKRKPALLTHLIQEHNWYQVLVFSRTKHGANRLAKQLEGSGIEAAAIHGNKSQNARTRALADFKSGKIRALVATDIAARGLDIEQLPQVVNVDLPNVPEDYVHRIGRTGRAGATGQAISLVSADEFQQLTDIERLTQQQLERKIVAGFEPGEPLPAARPLQAPKRKRPKKPKKTGVAQDQRQSSSGNQGDQKAARPAGNRPPRGNKPGGGNGQQRRRRRPSGNRAQARTGS